MTERDGELAETLVADGSATLAAVSAPGEGGLETGAILSDRWELLGLLGSGGMGSVYRARDRELDEFVAVKVLRRELSRSPTMIERFRREVKLARRVTHPNVARTFDIGEHGDLRFLTMELLDGRPLSSVIQRGRGLSVARIVAITRAICEGLSAAHAAGVVHRDLKPDNVLLDRSGRIVITDFGIARALEIEGGAGDTQGAVVGTPLYMAPEQIAHDAPIGPPADLYALGCMLFEMATGAPPWSGPTPLAIAAARLVAAAAPSAGAQAPELPEVLVGVIDRLLQRQVGDRFATPEDVQEALASLPSASSKAAAGPSLPPLGGASVRIATGASTGANSTPWLAPKTVAVLPIENRGEPKDSYLAAGLTDDLVDLLSTAPGLRVRPRALAERAAHVGEGRERERDPRDVGRDLDVQVVVSGELRRQGDTLQATVRVVTVEDGFQLWAGRFRTPAGEFLRIGDEAAAAIAEVLLSRSVGAREAPTDPRALDLYLRGRFLLRRTWGATPEAIPLLREAADRAPHDMTIGVTYARALVRGVAIGDLSPEASATAWTIIEEALRREPALAEARQARAALYIARGDVLDGIADLRAALSKKPDLHEAMVSLGDLMADAGASAGAKRLLSRAADLDPGHLVPRFGLARMAALSGDFEEARRLLRMAASDRFDRMALGIVRARLALWAGDRAEARRVHEEFVEPAEPGFLRDVLATVVNATLGEVASDDQLLRVRFGLAPGAGPRVTAFHLRFRAEVVARVGDVEASIDAVVAAVDKGTFDQPWADHCPALDPLRGIDRFEEAHQLIRARAERVRLACGDAALTSTAG